MSVVARLEKLTENADVFAKAYVAAKAEFVRAGMPEQQAQVTARELAVAATMAEFDAEGVEHG